MTLVAAVPAHRDLRGAVERDRAAARQQEALIGISQFLGLPLTFLSSAIMDPALAPRLDRRRARATTRSTGRSSRRREALLGSPGLVRWCGRGSLALAVLAVVMACAATRAFASYQKSL